MNGAVRGMLQSDGDADADEVRDGSHGDGESDHILKPVREEI